METFEFTVTDENGIHARPAGLLVKEAQNLSSELTVACKGKSVNLKKLLAVMSLGAKCGDVLTVTATGNDAGKDCEHLERFMKANL